MADPCAFPPPAAGYGGQYGASGAFPPGAAPGGGYGAPPQAQGGYGAGYDDFDLQRSFKLHHTLHWRVLYLVPVFIVS